jgi:tetratricopeptide (TPR) repeat protein
VKRLQEKPCLLIVDNFETVSDGKLHQFVLSLPEPGKCLITSRTMGLRQARSVSLRGMAKEEALLLIKNEGIRLGLNLETLLENEDNFRRFYEATGGAPLAIRWAIGQIKQRGQSIEGVLNSLHGARGDIFEFIFQRAWSLLSEPAKKILTIMPVFAASASKAAIEAASDIHQWGLDEALGQLVELWPNLEWQAKVRLVEFFENFARSVVNEKWAWQRWDEIEEEKDNIFTLIQWCFENDASLRGMELTRFVMSFMILRGYHQEARKFGYQAVKVARQERKKFELAWLLVHGVGWIETISQNLDKGEILFREGLKIFEALRNSEEVIYTIRRLAGALRSKGDLDTARSYYERGISLIANVNIVDQFAIIRFKRGLGVLAKSEGKLHEAREILELILPDMRENRNDLPLAGTLGSLSKIYYEIGDYEIAYKIGCEGLEVAKELKIRTSAASISLILAKIEDARCNYQSALYLGHQALDFYERSGLNLQRIEETKTLIHQLQERLTHSRKGKN